MQSVKLQIKCTLLDVVNKTFLHSYIYTNQCVNYKMFNTGSISSSIIKHLLTHSFTIHSRINHCVSVQKSSLLTLFFS